MLPLDRITPLDRCLPSEESSPFLLYGFPPCNQWPVGEYCEETSGGEHTEYLPLRRYGVGIACLDPRDLVLNTVLPGAVINSLGRVETVFRAELQATIIDVQSVLLGPTPFVPDSKVNVDRFEAGQEVCLQSTNNGVWFLTRTHGQIKRRTTTKVRPR